MYVNCTGKQQPALKITLPRNKGKITAAVWGALDEYLIFGHERGELTQWDVSSGEEMVAQYDDHTDKINDMQLSQDGTMLITSSKDTYSKVGQLVSGCLLKAMIFRLETQISICYCRMCCGNTV